MRGPLGLLLTLAIAFVLSTYIFGLSGLVFWVTMISTVLIFKGYTSMADSLPFPGKKTAKYLGVGLLAMTVFMYGWFGLPAAIPFTWEGLSGSLAGASVIGTPISTPSAVMNQVTTCAAGISPELKSQTVTVTTNAYDVEASAGYGTAVDLTTSCFYYKNGNSGGNFVTLSADTADGSVTTVWAPGDAIYAYCGGSSYYVEPVEGLCVIDRTTPLVLKAHAAATASQLSAVAFDKNMNALTAGGNTTTADYDLTLGASATEKVYVEWTVNAAVKAYNAYAFAVGVGNDIKTIAVSAGGVATSPAITPDNFRNVKVSDEDNGGATNNQTVTYSVYVFSTPVLLRQWQSLKQGFEVTSGSTDPTATDNVFNTIDLGVVCLLDGQYGKDPSSGSSYLDFYTHSTIGSQTDIGVVNYPHVPVGKTDCVVFEGN